MVMRGLRIGAEIILLGIMSLMILSVAATFLVISPLWWAAEKALLWTWIDATKKARS